MTDTSVDVRINRHVAEADVAIVVGPVFPHEVVGFSGGNKYFFPGVSGQELIDLSHWVEQGDIQLTDVLASGAVPTTDGALEIVLEGYGHRWLRIHPVGDLRIP